MTKIIERGMIFNGEMVRAILNGRKAQTRRIVNWHGLNEGLNLNFSGLEAREYPNGWVIESDSRSSSEWRCKPTLCPFGSIGDRIWVRETWEIVSHELDEDGRIQPWTPDRPATVIHEMPFGNGYYSGHAIYAADGDFTQGDDDGYEDGRSCWKPSIHMPRAASRILLEITDVRVKRLREISQADAEAEGVGKLKKGFWKNYQPGWTEFQLTARGSFATLWKSIYGDESWYADPWVWVIEFKRIEEQTA